MKKYFLLFILLVPCSMTWAQKYVVSSLATPGAATFTADEIKDGVITLPFNATTHFINIETNQRKAAVLCDAKWCQPSLNDNTLVLNVTENTTEESRKATLTITSKDFRPLLITVK